ncbi:MAG: hypothetical protein U0794_22010 [Isosphaeraceae bacterium]
MHRGFVWKADDFQRLADPSEARANQYQKTCHRRDGLGAAQVVVRQNACAEPRDQFLPPVSFFPATAVLRPDPVTWLGLPGRPAGQDVLELSDSRRLQTVELGARTMPLAADPDAAISMAENAVGGQRYTWAGFLNPTVELSLAQVGLMEPYQPGKVVVVFVHGLLDNPYVFSDAVADLGGRPGFLDHYQVAVFRYPTGNSFLRSAAIFRRQLRALAATYDPAGTDPGMQNLVLVGYSMGGLLSKLQITSSGDALWATAANVPLDSLVAPDSSKALLRDIFYFEPVTNVRRVIYIATPHDGSDVATRFVGRLGSRVVQRPADARRIVEQITRDNPGAVKPIGEVIPSSIDLLARRGSLLQAMQSLAVNPVVTYHTIAGTGLGPERCARGDLVVPLNSAIIPGAASTLPVRATHFSIYHIADTINEVERILHEHSQSLGLPAP